MYRRWSLMRQLKLNVLRLIRLRAEPNDIAKGFALGIFIGMTPTFGIQMVIAVFLAMLLEENKIAAAVGVWITNPLTIPPIYAATYWLGTLFWAGPPAATIYKTLTVAVRKLGSFSFWEMYGQFIAFFTVARDIFAPLVIGGVLAGALLGGVSYLGTIQLLRGYRLRRARRRVASARRGSDE